MCHKTTDQPTNHPTVGYWLEDPFDIWQGSGGSLTLGTKITGNAPGT